MLLLRAAMLKKIRKTLLILVILAAASVIVLVNQTNKPQQAQAEQLVLRLAETYPSGHPSAAAAQKFAELAYERTDGRINIKVYYDGELGNELEVLKQIQFGGIALARVNFLELSDSVTALQEYILPYHFESPEALLEALADKEESLSLKLQMEKFIPMVYYYPDFRCFYNNRVTINDPLDFKDLKLKASTSHKMVSILQTLGASPVAILTGNTFKSLSAGYMDGGETSLCEFFLSDYASMVPNVTLSRYLYSPDCIIASSVSLRDVSRADHELLQQCARDTFAYQKELLQKMQQEALDTTYEREFVIREQPFLETRLSELFRATEEGGP